MNSFFNAGFQNSSVYGDGAHQYNSVGSNSNDSSSARPPWEKKAEKQTSWQAYGTESYSHFNGIQNQMNQVIFDNGTDQLGRTYESGQSSWLKRHDQTQTVGYPMGRTGGQQAASPQGMAYNSYGAQSQTYQGQTDLQQGGASLRVNSNPTSQTGSSYGMQSQQPLPPYTQQPSQQTSAYSSQPRSDSSAYAGQPALQQGYTSKYGTGNQPQGQLPSYGAAGGQQLNSYSSQNQSTLHNYSSNRSLQSSQQAYRQNSQTSLFPAGSTTQNALQQNSSSLQQQYTQQTQSHVGYASAQAQQVSMGQQYGMQPASSNAGQFGSQQAGQMGAYYNATANSFQQVSMGMGMPMAVQEVQPPEPPKPKVVEAREVFLKPGRESRPDRICVILRGLPGSGKTFIAQKLRDIEKAAPGGLQPRILSLDDYFLTETVEMKTDANGIRRKEKVMKYEFDPEMETVYIAAFLKSFKKTIDDGHFRFIIVEGINCMVCHFDEFWSAAKSKGFEVYVVELPLDTELCASRNKYNWNADELRQVADRWEQTPAHMLVLETKTLFDELEQEATDKDQGDDASSETKRKRRGFQEADFSKLSTPSEKRLDEPKRKRRSFREAEFSEFSLENLKSSTDISYKKENPKAEPKPKSRWANDSESENDSDDGEENALSSLLGEYSSAKKKKTKRRVTWADPVDDWGDRSKRYLFEEGGKKEEPSGGFMLGAVKSAQKIKEDMERQERLKNVKGIVRQTLSDDRSILDRALKEHHIKNKKQNILTALHQLVEEEEDSDS